VAAFSLAATLAAGLAFGALPAWRLTGTSADVPLGGHGRGAVRPAGELRWGRWLVGAQLALSLPLLVVAGLLVQTVYNLHRPDLGFRAERLLLARVNLGEAAQDVRRRDRVLRDLRVRLQQIPGVERATFSQLGLFGGGISTATIDVQGSELTREGGRGSALDRVGADYFTTLGIPVRLGRDISESDGADSHKVAVVNEAFVERFFDGRNPIGMRITTEDGGDEGSTAYEVVGVSGNARTRNLRDEVEPRFFVPAEQRASPSTSRTFLIRTVSEATPLVSAARETMNGVDAAVSVSEIISIEDQMAPLTADEQMVARLAAVFGTVALMLVAIGLYGLLSYGVSRRASEIAIRMALGARSRGIIAMILRETVGLVVAGLLLGSALAYVLSRLISSRLYGVAPQDPLTATAATGVLLLAALIAAYLPARRASQMDPMLVLRRACE
jgi:predicted permease